MTFHDIFSTHKEEKNKIEITVDHREKNSLVPAELISKGCEIKFEQLPVGDYLIKGIAVERKTVADLKSSIINKRIISQIQELKQFPEHLLIVEGIIHEDIYSGGIHENALRGFLLSIALQFKTPIIFTHNEKDTAKYILVLAKKEKKNEHSIRATKITLTDAEQAQFILEGFPHVGPTKAKKLIEKFHSLNNIFNAPKEDLEEILGKQAEEFRELLEKEIL